MAGRWAGTHTGAHPRAERVRSALPLIHADRSGRVVEWNEPAEELSGISASEAVGRRCWEVIRGHDAGGGIVCHPGCSILRLAREGWPVSCAELCVSMPSGVEQLAVSTIVVGAGEDVVVLHPLHVVRPRPEVPPPSAAAIELTPRQREILGLLAGGVRAQEIAYRLTLSPATVRNHIHAVLRRLEVNSQLAAVAKARELGLLDRAGERTRPQRSAQLGNFAQALAGEPP